MRMTRKTFICLFLFFKCPISVFAGLTSGYERAKSGGIIWQMLGDMKTTRRVGQCIMALGGRYDSMLTEFQYVTDCPLTEF